MKDRLLELQDKAREAISKAVSQVDLDKIRSKYLGRKGEITDIMKSIGTLPVEDRPIIGSMANKIKKELEKLFSERLETVKKENDQKKKDSDPKREITSDDITLPGRTMPIGKRHIMKEVLDEVVDIFYGMGFSIARGPDVETAFYNFDALNTPKEHPSRDIGDTFYMEGNNPDDDNPLLLRTHTSPVQIRTMLENDPPVKIIAPGRCYRRDTIDASHHMNFWQCEGLYIDRGITMADLKGVLTAFAKELLGSKTEIRFRPHFFPFTEPSVEYDFSCICGGEGCKLCKGTGWVEISGAGMVDPEVLKAVGYDHQEYSGYAFGMGIERVAMIRHGIDDIRYFYTNDLRMHSQL